ncbi:MAG: adenylate cyclase [Gammaproteobacteria bacterium]|jgi:adenylate cyclase
MSHRLRLVSGLVLAAFVLMHFTNHMGALISLDVAEQLRGAFHTVWGSRPAGVLLYLAFATHFALALLSVYRRRTLRLAPWELIQLALGLLIIPIAAAHIVATRGGHEILGINHEYVRIVAAIWSDQTSIFKQVCLTLAVWLHVAFGLHFWLRLRPSYRRWSHLWGALYALVPVLTLLGFFRAGRDAEQLSRVAMDASFQRLGVDLPTYQALVQDGTTIVWSIAGVLLAGTLLARVVRRYRTERSSTYFIEHAERGRVRASVGQTILEAMRINGIAHASVCGGRGRCTTCRVRVGQGLEALPAPNALEQAALTRIDAEPTVRLACQTRPEQSVNITPLVPAQTAVFRPGRAESVGGTERVISVLFIDLRGSANLGQTRLPYDVLFILNQFFSQMSAALRDTAGHYAQFNGDGLMAIYGLEGEVRDGARDALRGAGEMLRRLADLNRHLGKELREPLRVGIGIHTGAAIVGTMGPLSAPIFSAIGKNVNIAARLEASTKTLHAPVVVSAQTAAYAQINTSGIAAHEIPIPGREDQFAVFAMDDPTTLVFDDLPTRTTSTERP